MEDVKRHIDGSRVSTDAGRGEQLAIYPPAAMLRRAGHALRVSMTSHVVERDKYGSYCRVVNTALTGRHRFCRVDVERHSLAV